MLALSQSLYEIIDASFFILTVLYLVNLHRGHQYCITELLLFAGQIRCTLQR
jgi:hypothetical protein